MIRRYIPFTSQPSDDETMDRGGKEKREHYQNSDLVEFE